MSSTRFWVIVCLIVAFIAGLTVSWLQHRHSFSEIAQANAPVIQTLHYPDSFAKQIKGNPKAGKIVYHAYCVSCHAPNARIPVHAPQLNQKLLWQALRSLGQKKLLNNTINGIGGMPARGGCFECDDQSLKKAINYMMQQSTGKPFHD